MRNLLYPVNRNLLNKIFGRAILNSTHEQDPTNLKIGATYRLRLFLVILIFIVIFTFFSYLRYADFFTSNWDFGIFQQMFWSTSHGKLLYESGDYISYGVNSFLEVHSGYIAFFFSFLYSFYPTPVTIFIIQTVAVSLTIIPLYKIALYYGASQSTAFIFTIPVLLNFAIISAMFYDFHLESMIPLEFLTLFYFAIRKKYIWTSLIFVLGCLTLEVFPFLSAGLGLYLLMLYFTERRRNIPKKASGITFPFVLIVASGIAYILIRVVQYNILPAFLNNTVSMAIPGNSVSGNILSLFNITSTPASLLASAIYWFLLLASLAFIPLLKPKALILAIPWFIASVFLHPFFSFQFGNQYALIAITPLLISYAEGLSIFNDRQKINKNSKVRTVNGYFIPLALISPIPGISALLVGFQYITIAAPILIVSAFCAGTVSFLYFKKNILGKSFKSLGLFEFSKKLQKPGVPFVVLIILILVFNISLGPLNTTNFDANPSPGYQFKYELSPASTIVTSMVKSVPYNSTLVTSDNLFPYAANRLDSYSFLWFSENETSHIPFFPFNSTNLPEYVMVSSLQENDVPMFLQKTLKNTGIYGLTMVLEGKGLAGNVYLYKLGYSGSTIYNNY